jgi:phage terminase small subunit
MPRQSAAARLVPTPLNRGRSRLDPPATLSDPERTVFVSTVNACDPSHFTPADLPLLISYCQAAVASAEAAAKVKATGAVDAAGNTSPWHGVWLKQVRALATLARLLRITPLSRTPRYAKPNRPVPEPWRRDDGERGQ